MAEHSAVLARQPREGQRSFLAAISRGGLNSRAVETITQNDAPSCAFVRWRARVSLTQVRLSMSAALLREASTGGRDHCISATSTALRIAALLSPFLKAPAGKNRAILMQKILPPNRISRGSAAQPRDTRSAS
jgi:hypothetical protein